MHIENFILNTISKGSLISSRLLWAIMTSLIISGQGRLGASFFGHLCFIVSLLPDYSHTYFQQYVCRVYHSASHLLKVEAHVLSFTITDDFKVCDGKVEAHGILASNSLSLSDVVDTRGSTAASVYMQQGFTT